MRLTNKLRRIIISVILAISLVLSPSFVAMAGNDPGLDQPSFSESSPSPEPSPAPSSEPTVSPSPSPTTSFDGPTVIDPNDRDGDAETPEEDALHDAERERKWEEYQASLASQGPGDSESTGGIEGGGNVGDTVIETGDANANGVIVTSANTTAVSAGGSGCGACVGDTSATNSGNGENSNNSAAVNNNNNSTVVINNVASVENNLDFDANTGYNDASANVGDSEIITGDANVVVTVITDANEVGLGVYQFDVNGNQNGDIILDPGSSTVQNIGNGSGSTNDATINNTNTNVETINNEGDIINNIDIDANTGYNSTSKNTGGDSSIETGDANVVANVVNALNTVVDGTMNVVNIFGDMVGNIVQPETPTSDSTCACECAQDVTAANIGNGDNSDNTTVVNNSNTNTTNMTNNATVANNLYLDGNTGENSTNGNTGGFSSIETGDVTVDANVVNIANVNVSAGSCEPIYFVFINDISGGWQGQILGAAPGTYFYTSDGSIYFVDQNGQLVAMNKDNGTDSVNNSTINNTNTNTTNITNNGSITNNINIDANTGDNDASKNTNGDSNIKTGDANIVVNVVNFINSNFSGRKIVMTLVNVFGSWVGHFVPAGFSAPESAQAQDGQGGSGGSSSGGGGSSSSSGGSSSSSVAQSNTVFGPGGGFSGLVSGFKIEKKVTEDDSIALADPTSYSSQTETGGFPIDPRFLLAFIPAAILAVLLRRKFAASK